MRKLIADVPVGKFVTLWCIGTATWDDDVVEIIEQGMIVSIRYRNGGTAQISCGARCRPAYF